MTATDTGALSLTVNIEKFALKKPFRITGHIMSDADVVTVELARQGHVGRGEASGMYYRQNDDPHSIRRKIESLRSTIEAGVDREDLRRLLPIGGARNALDCALWDLEAKLTNRPAWQRAGLDPVRPLLTSFTVGADSPENMALDALAYPHAKAIKVKLTGQPCDADRIRAVRTVRPNVWLGVDANQGFSRTFLENLMPVLVETKVDLIEQPFAVGSESLLDGFDSPIPLAADESVQDGTDLRGLVGRFDVVNIKLDKCGGLTEGLAMAREASRLGLKVMVGNTVGTSLAMAPGFLLGQLCAVVDLDGPAFLCVDRPLSVSYDDGMIFCPAELWGGRSDRQ